MKYIQTNKVHLAAVFISSLPPASLFSPPPRLVDIPTDVTGEFIVYASSTQYIQVYGSTEIFISSVKYSNI